MLHLDARRQRTPRLRPAVRPLPPDRIIGSYYARLEPLMDEMQGILARELMPEIGRIHEQLGGRTDSAGTQLVLPKILDKVGARYSKMLTVNTLAPIVSGIQGQVSTHSDRQTTRVLRSMIGVSPLLKQPRLLRKSRTFTRQNVQLIQSIGPDYLHRVNRGIRKGIAEGMRVETLAKKVEIQWLAKSTGRRPMNLQAHARLIARDQVLKHNAQLTRARHEAVGITHYVWRVTDDERLRDRHEDLAGRTFAYGASPIGVDPGVDYQCRCHGEPVLSGEVFVRLSLV